MATAYAYRSRAGIFRIALGRRGWMLALDDDVFDGPFRTAQHALDDLVGGHCFWPACGDPSGFGLPDEISDWSVLPSAR